MDGVQRLAAWIVEREATRIRKESGRPLIDHFQDTTGNGGKSVWTLDPIIGAYRFCNVRREDDKITRWIADNWRRPHADDPDLWFAMLVARFINWPDTLQELGYPVPWNPSDFLQAMARRKAAKLKCYTGAYMVRADREHADKAAYQEHIVFTPMWEHRSALRPQPNDTLNSYHTLLGQFHGLGSFMAAQIVADLKYTKMFAHEDPEYRCSDWWTFAASGPGSRRGLNRVLGRPVNSPWTEEAWRGALGRLQVEINSMIGDIGPLHGQDIQSGLCEIDKYERVRLGEGRPRSKYP